MKVNFFHLILAVVFTSTIDYRLFEGIPGMPSITFTEIIAYSAFFLYVTRAAFQDTEIIAEISGIYASRKVVFLYFGWGALAAMAGVLVKGELDVLETYRSLLPALVVYVLILLFVDSATKAYLLMATFMAGMCLNVVLGLLQIATGGPRPVPVNEAFTQKLNYDGKFIDNAPTGLFNHPNGLALLLLPAAILLAVLLFRKNRRVGEYLMICVSLVLVWVVMIMTYAKGAVAWAGIGTLLALLQARFVRLRVPLAVCASLGGILFMIGYSLLRVTEGQVALATMLTRVYLWVAAWEIIRNDLFVQLLGNGITDMAIASYKFANLEYANAHNGVINQALFYGIPALCFYVAIFTGSLTRGASILRKCPDDLRPLPLFVLAALPALFGEYFFEPVSVNMTLQVHLFVIVAIGETAARFAGREGGEVQPV